MNVICDSLIVDYNIFLKKLLKELFVIERNISQQTKKNKLL